MVRVTTSMPFLARLIQDNEKIHNKSFMRTAGIWRILQGHTYQEIP